MKFLLWTVTTIHLFTTILSGLLRSCTIQQWITLDGIGYYADLLDMIFTRRAAGFWSNFVLLISPLCCAPEPHVTHHAHDTMCSKRSVTERARKRRRWASSLPVYKFMFIFHITIAYCVCEDSYLSKQRNRSTYATRANKMHTCKNACQLAQLCALYYYSN